jgi:hypothetical protein
MDTAFVRAQDTLSIGSGGELLCMVAGAGPSTSAVK